MTETLTIQNVQKQVIQERYSNVIMESDSFITIQAINGKFKPSIQICNLIEDITMLVKKIDDIKFVYKRSTNEIAYMRANGPLVL